MHEKRTMAEAIVSPMMGRTRESSCMAVMEVNARPTRAKLAESMSSESTNAAQMAKYALDVAVNGLKKVSTIAAGAHHATRKTAKHCSIESSPRTLGSVQLE